MQLYTYAQPLAADLEFARHYAADPYLTYYRFENPVDPVPMVPSRRLAQDLIKLLGKLPDALFKFVGRLDLYVRMAVLLGVEKDEELIAGWTAAEVHALHKSVENGRRYIEELHFQQCRVTLLSFAELALTLAPPTLDARHFGVRCSCERASERKDGRTSLKRGPSSGR